MYKNICILLMATLLLVAFSGAAFSAPPVVKTVPWVPTNPLVPHDTWSGKTITLKGTADVQGATIQYTWDFGDGSPVATGTVTNRYVIEAKHAYTAPAGTVFTARLTVNNTSTAETGSKAYYVAVRNKTLPVEVNVAIDEGLWYLHRTQRRYNSGGIDYGEWWNTPSPMPSGCCWATLGYTGVSAVNINAFEVNGHLETSDPANPNPYGETVARALRFLFTRLSVRPIGSQTNSLGAFNPDNLGNGIGLYVTEGYEQYQGGMVMDAIIATGTPNAIATTGGGNVVGRKYKDILQDMVDDYAYCQYDSPGGGGWRYSCNQYPDNSACQWAAIGLIPATRNWGSVLHALVPQWNQHWLAASQHTGTGEFGYQPGYWRPWGPYAVTPSGMVQMAMDGIGRGTPGPIGGWPQWNKAESFIRDNFPNGGGYSNSIKAYYYGLFSFVKSMLLHQRGTNPPEQLKFLRSDTAGVGPVRWYEAEVGLDQGTVLASEAETLVPAGTVLGLAPTDGVARTLVRDQDATYGYWYNAVSSHGYFSTAWAIIMLNRTLFEAGAPVAVAKATPNPAVVGQTVTLDGSDSYHQDASRIIDSWQWDFNNDGIWDASGPQVTRSFGALGDYPVRLRVTDDGTPEKEAVTIITVRVTTPPIAPTADANGPYNFCPGPQWFLDGTGSVNPDEGQHESGPYPGDTIVGRYTWDLNGDNVFGDRTGPAPNVTGYWTPGSYLVQLKVCDTTAASFPSSGMGDLCSTSSAQVVVRSATDPACSCVFNLAARAKPTKADLTWSWRPGAHHYNVYRSTISGGPYLKIGAVYSPGLPGTGVYADSGLTNGVTYYWVVREAAINNDELCQSNQASATPTSR